MEPRLYGAWVSKDEIIPVIGYECHDDVALDIIRNIFKLKENHFSPRRYSVYRVLLRLGYVRIKYLRTNYNNEKVVEVANYYPFNKLSEFQKNIVKSAIYTDFSHLYSRQLEQIMDLNKRLNGW